ncbi:hypothetical protein DPQ33_04675 [Oceanidesulfovibrio indonesiensis]|uniref:Uncharacterized protein n=1 Tax=Oceanidesulfovibrio indonesiensis TaxID=54767 RepID=A0A7M3MH09_9BACT|nr:hypothetical protein [Oceanidesulfovibrio indonesiensis]TVM18771.1 hypothetical protein DPQ33_04675 [Oceanidesulfovibrio indonesiensis]
MKRFVRVIAVLLMFTGLSSCITAHKMDISHVRFRCRFVVAEVEAGDQLAASSSCNFFFQDYMCDQYADVLRVSYENRESCIDACTDVATMSSRQYGAMICSRLIHRGKTICQQYCRQHYEYSDRQES